MKTISELQNDIKALNLQLNQLAINMQNIRPELKINDDLDMKKIKSIAQKHPIKNHALMNCDDYVKQRYLSLLIVTARIMQSDFEKSLLLIHRIAYGAGYQEDIAAILKDSNSLSERSLEAIVDTFNNDSIKMLLVLDMLLLTAEKKKKDSLRFIAEVSFLLGICEEEMRFLSNLAVVILQNDLNSFIMYTGVDYDAWCPVLHCYLTNFNFLRELIKIPKYVLIGLGDYNYNVNLEVKTNESLLLEAGNTICVMKDEDKMNKQPGIESSIERKLEKKMSDIKEEYLLNTPKTGKVYIFETNANTDNSTVGVITHPLDQLENARDWFYHHK